MKGECVVDLKDSLVFLYVKELREWAERLGLASTGGKMQVVDRIVHFAETGERLPAPVIPQASRAKRGHAYAIGLQEKMVKGAYKNDLRTRQFFKAVIGDYFHFTAFGIDWLNERWLAGDPPTYGEFAKMWEEEYQKRKQFPVSPKKEWAYIRFVQEYLERVPGASQSEVHKAWEAAREHHKRCVAERLSSLQQEQLLD